MYTMQFQFEDKDICIYYIHGRIQGGRTRRPPPPPPPKIGKNMILWRKIVISHTNTPKIFAPPSAIGNNIIFGVKS